MEPHEGRLISFDVKVMPEGGCKAREAGVTLTKAGATFPYGIEPEDKNIRLAPSFPTPAELASAIEIVCTCIELVALEKILLNEVNR